MSDVQWEYWGDFTSTRDLLEFYGGTPSNRGHYTLVDSKPIKKSVGISCKGMTKDDMLVVQQAMETCGLTPQVYTMADGSTISGIPTNFNATPIEHSALYSVKLAIRCDGSGEALWAYYGDCSYTRDFMEVYNPSSPGTPGAYDLLNIYPTKCSVNMNAKGVTKAYAESLATKIASGTTQSFTMADGTVFTGLITSCGQTLVEYTSLYDIKMTLRLDGVAVGSGSSGVTWKAYASHSVERSLTEFHEAPNNGTYGAVTFYDLQMPKYTVAVTADNVPATAIDTIMALVSGTTPVSSFSFGGSPSGFPVSASCEQVKLTQMYNVKVTLRIH